MVERQKLQVSIDWTLTERESLSLLIQRDIAALGKKQKDFQVSIPWNTAVFMEIRDSIRELVVMKRSVYESSREVLESDRSRYVDYLVSN